MKIFRRKLSVRLRPVLPYIRWHRNKNTARQFKSLTSWPIVFLDMCYVMKKVTFPPIGYRSAWQLAAAPPSGIENVKNTCKWLARLNNSYMTNSGRLQSISRTESNAKFALYGFRLNFNSMTVFGDRRQKPQFRGKTLFAWHWKIDSRSLCVICLRRDPMESLMHHRRPSSSKLNIC